MATAAVIDGGMPPQGSSSAMRSLLANGLGPAAQSAGLLAILDSLERQPTLAAAQLADACNNDKGHHHQQQQQQQQQTLGHDDTPGSNETAILACLARIAERLSKQQDIVIATGSSTNTSTSTSNNNNNSNNLGVSRLIGMYNNKAGGSGNNINLNTNNGINTPRSRVTSTSSNSGSGTTAIPPLATSALISSPASGNNQPLSAVTASSSGSGSGNSGTGAVRPAVEGENEENERLCHRCGGHIIRAEEVGLDDEEVIDGQSESLSAEKELKLLKAQVQDFARVCKVSFLWPVEGGRFGQY